MLVDTRCVASGRGVMDLVLVAAVAVSVWMTIVVIAIGMCRVASRTEMREKGNVEVRPGTDSALGRARVPAL